MIYTSYFSKVKKDGIPKERIVNIARKPIDGITQAIYLAPPQALLVSWKYQWPQDSEHWDMYRKTYYKYLDSININNALVENLKQLWWQDKILCCFERSDNKFCHRHILREWLSDHGINDIKEIP